MTRMKPFLGETTDRKKAFPDLASCEISIIQDKFELYDCTPSRRQSRFTLENVPREMRCVNSRCQQGGLDLQNIITSWPDGQHTFYCNGHEGSPQGRRKGDPCENSFDVTLSTVRK